MLRPIPWWLREVSCSEVNRIILTSSCWHSRLLQTRRQHRDWWEKNDRRNDPWLSLVLLLCTYLLVTILYTTIVFLLMYARDHVKWSSRSWPTATQTGERKQNFIFYITPVVVNYKSSWTFSSLKKMTIRRGLHILKTTKVIPSGPWQVICWVIEFEFKNKITREGWRNSCASGISCCWVLFILLQ